MAQNLLGKCNYDGYFLEYDTDRAGGFEPLRFLPKGNKIVVLGLVTSKSGRLEPRADIKKRIEEATKFVALDQLGLSPQCGFASTEEGNVLAEDEQWAKLRMIESIPAQSEQDKRRIEAFQQMTPEKVAPLAVYLCTEAATGITGQIFSVRNNEIYLFNQPRPVKTIHRAKGWTPEELATELKTAFAPAFTPLERSEEVFNWDPI